jgi:hypothetical protein
MITVTPAAADAIRGALKEQGVVPFVRVYVAGMG